MKMIERLDECKTLDFLPLSHRDVVPSEKIMEKIEDSEVIKKIMLNSSEHENSAAHKTTKMLKNKDFSCFKTQMLFLSCY